MTMDRHAELAEKLDASGCLRSRRTFEKNGYDAGLLERGGEPTNHYPGRVAELARVVARGCGRLAEQHPRHQASR